MASTVGKTSGRTNLAGGLLQLAVLAGSCAGNAHAVLGAVESPPVSLVQLEVQNQLQFNIEAVISSPATPGTEQPTRVDAGKTWNVPIDVADPLAPSAFKVTVYTSSLDFTGAVDVYSEPGPALARATASAGFRAELLGFCKTGDGKDGLHIKGFPNPPLGVCGCECAGHLLS